jgi:alpha-ketoglutarate-dependent taurine dioxygenase
MATRTFRRWVTRRQQHRCCYGTTSVDAAALFRTEAVTPRREFFDTPPAATNVQRVEFAVPTTPPFRVTATTCESAQTLHFCLETPNVAHSAVTVSVDAGWAADHDMTSFNKTTFQRSDPVPYCASRRVASLAEPRLKDPNAMLIELEAASASTKEATTTWCTAARRCRVPLAAIFASALSECETPGMCDALSTALKSMPNHADRCCQGYTTFHARLVNRYLRAADVADNGLTTMAPALSSAFREFREPELWLAKDVNHVLARGRFGSYALPGPTSSEPAAKHCSRSDILNAIAQFGFAVARDIGVRNGVDERVDPESLALGQPYHACTTVSADKKELLQRRTRGIGALTASTFGVVRYTHYGGVSTWGDSEIIVGDRARPHPTSTASTDPTHLDTAYMRVGIGLHTDGSYLAEPPAMQIFGCLHRCPLSSSGGKSEVCDGFAVANLLRAEDRTLFDVLCSTPVVATYYKQGRAFTGSRPVIMLDRHVASRFNGHWGVNSGEPEVAQVTYNPYDRAPTLAGVSGLRHLDRFYAAYHRFGELCGENAAVFQLEVGDVLFFNNLRVLHSRTPYAGPRIMGGAYVGADDVASALVSSIQQHDQ